MIKEYDGIKYFECDGFRYDIEKIKRRLPELLSKQGENTINEIIELYNISNIIKSDVNVRDRLGLTREQERDISSIVVDFYRQISNETLKHCYQDLYFGYVEDFWHLFNMFHIYENISPTSILELLKDHINSLRLILKHKGIVDFYDVSLADFMRESDMTADILVRKYLARDIFDTQETLYIPSSLNGHDFEEILNKYIESQSVNVGILYLIALNKRLGNFSISDQLRLKAKKKVDNVWADKIKAGDVIQYSVNTIFEDIPAAVIHLRRESFHDLYIYDVKKILGKKDFLSLLHNFIWPFKYVDEHFRSVFPSFMAELFVVEKIAGWHGHKEYLTGEKYSFKDMKSNSEIIEYSQLLEKNGIRIEDVFQWFFNVFLKERFGVDGFIVNMPSKDLTYLEKCKCLPQELDVICKQFKAYVENGCIDRELIEISSDPVPFESIPSLIDNKYLYVKSERIKTAQLLMFSQSSRLMIYLSNDGSSTAKTFFDVIISQNISAKNYNDFCSEDIETLKSMNIIYVDDAGIIRPNLPLINLLKDLYYNEVARPSYYQDKTEIDRLISLGDLEYKSSLFSIPEQKYLSYNLNKSKFDNGLDLRNKYCHGTYSTDNNQHYLDYNMLLKIAALIILKIYEEFLLLKSAKNTTSL